MQLAPPTLDATLGALSAMITPAVMILATGSLILTTTNRLVRALDRIREALPEFEKLAALDMHDDATDKKWAMMNEQIQRATARARLMQRALTRLYIALGTFLATSVALGVISFVRVNAAWVPLTLGLIGVGLLFSASVLMIIESRIALNSTYAEMDYIRSISRRLPTTTVKP
jgi:hypothetical protein